MSIAETAGVMKKPPKTCDMRAEEGAYARFRPVKNKFVPFLFVY